MNFIPGAIAGLTSAILGYPFDTIKTRMQVNNYGNSKNIFINTVKNEGFISLYRGISAPLITTTFKRSYQYYLFEEMKKRQVKPMESLLLLFLIFTNPELIKNNN